ncbi:MAG: YraN family protein [Candidatus Spechtbacterales bacterium]|nr:YraN family protein [Candidatus Spechtbacterales bacterium]
MLNSKSTGQIAEDVIAKRYLKSMGWKLLARNYNKPWGEIDIVAHKGKKVIFIEVKALNSKHKDNFKPEDHFTASKKEKLIKACASYLTENGYPEDVEYSIDLAAVEIDHNTRNAHVRYYKNAISY